MNPAANDCPLPDASVGCLATDSVRRISRTFGSPPRRPPLFFRSPIPTSAFPGRARHSGSPPMRANPGTDVLTEI